LLFTQEILTTLWQRGIILENYPAVYISLCMFSNLSPKFIARLEFLLLLCFICIYISQKPGWKKRTNKWSATTDFSYF
jgi:hypothetical protein